MINREVMLENTQPKQGQFVPDFQTFLEPQIAEAGQYTPPTPEQVDFMEARLDALADLMKDADFAWQLDGGTNISLLERRFVRNHKDVDIGVFDDELEKVEAYLQKHGYQFTKHRAEKDADGQRWVESISAVDILREDLDDIQIAKVGVNHSIEVGDTLDFVDLHISHRNSNGDTVTRYTGATIPKKFMQPVEFYRTRSGGEIPISHPALIVYHKIETGRSYDLTDITYLKKHISDDDIAFVEQMIQSEYENALKKFVPQFEQVFAQLSPEMSEDHIRTTLLQNQAIARMQTDPDGQRWLQEFPARYKSSAVMDTAQMVQDLVISVRAEEKVRARSAEKIQRLHQALGR